MQELQKWSTEKGIVSLTILSSGKARSDYLEPTKAEAFNKARGGVPLALLIDASGDMGHAYGALTANHLFIVDRSVLVYAGGIDDAESMDPKKVLSARSCVHPALEDVLAGRPSSEPVPILPDAQSLRLDARLRTSRRLLRCSAKPLHRPVQSAPNGHPSRQQAKEQQGVARERLEAFRRDRLRPTLRPRWSRM
jgi:hypothetical protein